MDISLAKSITDNDPVPCTMQSSHQKSIVDTYFIRNSRELINDDQLFCYTILIWKKKMKHCYVKIRVRFIEIRKNKSITSQGHRL
jgi:hypothetical protein